MANPTSIGPGPGNLAVESDIKEALATEAISEGEVLAITTALGTSSFEVSLADRGTPAISCAVAVAAEDIAIGVWGKVYVGGYCPKVLTDGSVAVGEFLIPADAVPGEADTFAAGSEHLVFGYALSTDAGTPDACDAILFRRGL